MSEPTNWFEHHVVTTLARLEEGQKDFIIKYEDHIVKDAEQFESIRVEQATSKASHEATSKTSAKFWAAIATALSVILSTVIHYLAKGK